MFEDKKANIITHLTERGFVCERDNKIYRQHLEDRFVQVVIFQYCVRLTVRDRSGREIVARLMIPGNSSADIIRDVENLIRDFKGPVL